MKKNQSTINSKASRLKPVNGKKITKPVLDSQEESKSMPAASASKPILGVSLTHMTPKNVIE